MKTLHYSAAPRKQVWDIMLGFDAFMEDAWPKALAKLKALCEAPA